MAEPILLDRLKRKGELTVHELEINGIPLEIVKRAVWALASRQVIEFTEEFNIRAWRKSVNAGASKPPSS